MPLPNLIADILADGLSENADFSIRDASKAV
jgi:hypothetical protein